MMGALANTLGWTLAALPWWIWPLGAAVLLVPTFQFWAPIWALVPRPLKMAAGGLAVIALAYLAGHNRGASDALQWTKDREAAHADRITDAAQRARDDADARNVGDRLRDDDGWRRH